MNQIMIRDMAKAEKPRERLLLYGKEAVSNEELISIILKTGTKNYSVKFLASKILSEYETLEALKEVSVEKLCEIKGIGKTKALTLIASLELGRRVYKDNNQIKIKFKNSKEIYDFFKNKFIFENQEKFCVVFLDNKNSLITYKVIFIGTLNMSLVHPREIFKEALKNNAANIICIHNHPSGDSTPSEEDLITTKKIMEGGKMLGIKVIDHIIIGNNNYYSFYEKEMKT